ncbi:MAG TPA: hypothetical protein PK987_03380 [Ferruginibacter sp.]|nr:hypothetical protein [Ferruginibacter sp.]
MYKILSLLIASFFCTTVHAQSDSLTFSKEEMRLLDSMFKNDEFIQLLLQKDRSYIDINVMMSNGIFSFNNNSLNAVQAKTNKIYYTPTVSYNHKSGLSISVNSSFTTDEGNLKMYQYAITPSYSFRNKNFDAGISYTRYFEGASTSLQMNPFKNDIYTSVNFKKTFIEPGLSLGYSFGKQIEYYDTAFWVLNSVVHIRDTITTKVNSLSLSLSASHQWNFNSVLSKKDAFQIRTYLLLNTGFQNWHISHSSSLVNRRPIVQTYVKRRFGNGTISTGFNIQSVAFSTNLMYYVGKFYLQPQIYLDYYLPSTNENRLTSIYSLTAGVTFY